MVDTSLCPHLEDGRYLKMNGEEGEDRRESLRTTGCRMFWSCASPVIRWCKQRGSSTNGPPPSSSLAALVSLPSSGCSSGGSDVTVGRGRYTLINLAAAVLTSFTNHTNSIHSETPQIPWLCKNGNMEAALLRARSHETGHGWWTIQSRGRCCLEGLVSVAAGEGGELCHGKGRRVWRASMLKSGVKTRHRSCAATTEEEDKSRKVLFPVKLHYTCNCYHKDALK